MFGFGTNLHPNVKLGKKQVRFDYRTLQFADYASCIDAAPKYPALPTSPSVCGYSQKLVPLTMMCNDALGDCTIAGVAHQIQAWTALNGNQILPADADVVKAYSAVTGYVPGNEATDNGAVLLDVLNYWRKNGLFGQQLTAFAQVAAGVPEQMRKAVYYFGGAYIGVQLPLSAQTQQVWDVPIYGPRFDGKPGSWGGHCVDVVDYYPGGVVVVTWGQLKLVTWKFLATYCDEAYALFSPDWLKNGVCPAKFAGDALAYDLSRIAILKY